MTASALRGPSDGSRRGLSPEPPYLSPGRDHPSPPIVNAALPGAAPPGAEPAHDPAADRGAANRRELERDLREALDSGNFHLHWQPIVDCQTGHLTSFEALVRWDRPGIGPAAPSVFVPIAEALGLHGQLDRWVLRQAIAEAALWPQPIRAAVNVSALWFRTDDLSRTVEALLAEAGLDPARLELEVTERVFIGEEAAAAREIAQLCALGVGIALDDFGTGYSSLGYLRTMAFTRLKLDRAFTEGLGTSRRIEVITRAVLNMGAGLGMAVCAEGVTNHAQLEVLQAYGCDEVQGYLIGRPGPLTPAQMAVQLRLDRSNLFASPGGLSPAFPSSASPSSPFPSSAMGQSALAGTEPPLHGRGHPAPAMAPLADVAG